MENIKDKQHQVDGFIDLVEKAEEKAGADVAKGYTKIEKGVVGGYKKIESGVVDGYKKIESTIVDGFNGVNDKIIEKVFSKDGENLEETKARTDAANARYDAAKK